MRTAWMVILLGMSAARAAHAADEDPKPTGTPLRRRAGSSVEITPYTGGDFVVRKINRTYDFIEPFDGQSGLLLSQEIETRRVRPPGEGWDVATVRVTAFGVSLTGKSEKRHGFVVTGQEGALLDRYRYQVTALGCCDALNGYVVYSVWTGKPILYASGWDSADSLIRLRDQPPSGAGADTDRWIGVYTNNAPYDDAVFGGPVRGTRAVVTYARTEAPLARVLVDLGPDVTTEYGVKKLAVKSGPLIAIELTDGSAIELPINDDRLDAAHARLPGGATAKALPAEWPARPKK